MDFKELFKHWTYQVFAPGTVLRRKYESFKSLLEIDRACLERIAELEEIYYGAVPVDWSRVHQLVRELLTQSDFLVRELLAMSPGSYLDLPDYRNKIAFYLTMATEPEEFVFAPPFAMDYEQALDHPHCAGGKAYNLAMAGKVAELPVPDGFVITCRAFHYFIEYNELQPRIDVLLAKVNLDAPGFVADICQEIQRLILSGEVPPDVEREYRARALTMAGSRGGRIRFALRSSARGEDGAASFAGQYESVLGVSLTDITAAYRKVLASKYSAKAVTYRIRYGLPDQQTPMAVLVTEMIEPAASGVVYTRDPSDERHDGLAVYAVPGMGRALVDGSASPEILHFDRAEEPRLLLRTPGGGAPQVVCGDTPGDAPCLPQAHAASLARVGLALEKLFGSPQDIEWCMDQGGSLYILQSRPLGGSQPEDRAPEAPVVDDEPILSGAAASPGVGIGTVCKPERMTELDDVAEGSVLVADTLSPSWASVLERLAAVVTDTGSKASHFASVAREFGLPVVVDTKFATRTLEPGAVVTVDGTGGRVYAGAVQALRDSARRPRIQRDTPFRKRLDDVMRRIAPLNLTDPESPDFAPEGCRSIHDIVRFCHERGVAEMFSLVGKGGRGLAQAKPLKSTLPVVMHVLDLGGGLTADAAKAKEIDPCHFASDTLSAVWEGLNHPDVQWDGSLLAFDWEQFDRMAGGVFSLKSKILSSYVVVAREYMHLLMRFGYHFAVVDALCTEHPDANYINFRFKGGGAAVGQRLLRLDFVDRVLRAAGFRVKITGDMLDARLVRASAPQIELNLNLIGTLLGRTRLMDMALTGDEQVQELVDQFLESI